jgi:hypothetical protein
LARADHFARLRDNAQIGSLDLKHLQKGSGKTFDLISF